MSGPSSSSRVDKIHHPDRLDVGSGHDFPVGEDRKVGQAGHEHAAYGRPQLR